MVTGNARVSDLAVAKVRRFCDQRVPAEARDEVCLEVTTRAATITIVERRPLWQGGPGAWTRMPITQLRYNYLDPTPQLDDLLKEIDEDPLCMFWG
jgi:hypothetical protein